MNTQAPVQTSERFPIGSCWRNKRSGVVAEVVGIDRDCLLLARKGMATTRKWIDHFVRQYVEAEKPVPLTRPRLEELLSAYAGAIQHTIWTSAAHATLEDNTRAQDAELRARESVIKAVFP